MPDYTDTEMLEILEKRLLAGGEILQGLVYGVRFVDKNGKEYHGLRLRDILDQLVKENAERMFR